MTNLFILGQSLEIRMKMCIFIYIYTDQNYKRNTFVFAPIFHELNSKI